MTAQPVGHLLDSLGVTVDLEDNEHLVDAVLIARLVPFGSDDDTPRLIMSRSDGLDWIGQVGLIHAARAVVDQPGEPVE